MKIRFLFFQAKAYLIIKKDSKKEFKPRLVLDNVI